MADNTEALAQRVETEPVEAQLWWIAFDLVVPAEQNGEAWTQFATFLDAKAWREAAAMLMPEGWETDVKIVGKYADAHVSKVVHDARKPFRIYEAGHATGSAAEARARLAAAIRAHAASKEPGR